MASKGISRRQPENQAASGWEQLTWDDVRAWCGSRDLEKGRSYKGRVSQLQVTADGRLLAWVQGTRRYATTTRLAAKGKPVSECSCPLQCDGCKHGVAVVLAFLDVLSQKKSVPTAADDDPRWKILREGTAEDSEDDFDADEFGDDESVEESDEDFDDDGGDGTSQGGRRFADRIRRLQKLAERPQSPTQKPKKADAGLRAFLQSKPVDQLIELLLGCAARDHEFRAVLQEQQALQGGNLKKLVQEARREIASATAAPSWSESWDDDDDSSADFSGVRRRLSTLLDAGHADAVVELGRELIPRGLQRVSQADDDFESSGDFTDCLEVVFQAVVKSSLAPCQKLMYAIEAVLQDDYDMTHHTELVFDTAWPAADWSLVADELLRRLAAIPVGKTEDWTRSYKRDRLGNWAIDALDTAGRGDEALTLCESEARLNGSYERLVKRLVEAKRWDDVERWAREGMANTSSKLGGIIHNLKKRLSDLATQRKDWPRVAAFAAEEFFDRPNVESFEQLLKAAQRAKCRESVEAAARRFLETGLRPGAAVESLVLSMDDHRPPRKSSRISTKIPASTGMNRENASKSIAVEIVEPALLSWPLPNLDLPAPRDDHLERRVAAARFAPKQHVKVLLELAIKAKQPDETLHWFDTLSTTTAGSIHWLHHDTVDRVAVAVAATHPERSLQLWNRLIDIEVAATTPAHYEVAAGYLRKVRNLLTTLDRTPEWNARLASLRETQRRKRRLIEILDGLAGRPIVHAT